jgi:MFS family permease
VRRTAWSSTSEAALGLVTAAFLTATPHFWLLLLVYCLTGLGSFFVSRHQLAFATDMGFDTLHAASIIGMGSFLSIGGTIFTGTISDYVGREVSAIIAYGISIIGVPDDHGQDGARVPALDRLVSRGLRRVLVPASPGAVARLTRPPPDNHARAYHQR